MMRESQKLAHKKWRKRNPKKERLYSDHSAAKRYVRNSRNVDHLEKLMAMIRLRIKDLR